MKIKIYTDGACSNNQNHEKSIGGWAYVVVNEQENKRDGNSGRIERTTNNRMEIYAILQALKSVYDIRKDYEFVIYTDSNYALQILLGNYKIKKNKDLWNKLLKVVKEFKNISYEKVKAHSGDSYNELVDTWAVLETQNKVVKF